MYSKILFKLIEESLIPSVGFFLIKVVVTFTMLSSFGYSVNFVSLFFAEVTKDQYIQIVSNVLLGFGIFSFLGVFYSLIKSLYFHSTHISPTNTIRLFHFRASFLIQDSFHLFTQSLIWLLYSYMALFLTLFLYYLGLVNGYVLVFLLVMCPIATYFYLLDLESEFENDEQDSIEVEEVVFQ